VSVARAIVGRLRDSDWAGGLLVCALFAATQACYRTASPAGFFDEGITFAAVSWARDGVLALGDAYTPYGPGMALPGLIATSVVAREAGVILAADAVAGAVAYAAVRRRAKMAVALGVALMATLGQLPRYALPIACLLLACYLVDRRLVRSSGSLATAVRSDGRGIGLAAAPIGLAAWFRPEWAVFLVPWAFVVWQACRFRRPALLPLLGPVAVAAVPLVALLATGGFRHMWWWLDYALFHYGSERATPFSLADAWAAVWSPLGSGEQQEGALVVVTYGAAAAARRSNRQCRPARRTALPRPRPQRALALPRAGRRTPGKSPGGAVLPRQRRGGRRARLERGRMAAVSTSRRRADACVCRGARGGSDGLAGGEPSPRR
jgi:hypothetical protein